MGNLIWLTEAQMQRIEPYFPLSHGVPRVDDRRFSQSQSASWRQRL
jgi:putative transposase